MNNLQPWVFLVIDDRSQLDKIAGALRDWSNQAEELKQYTEKSSKSEDKSERLMRTGAMEFFLKLERAPAITAGSDPTTIA